MRDTFSRTSCIGVPGSAVTATGAEETPVGARNSPNTSRRALDHSPVVTPARAHSSVASIRFSVPAAASLRRSSACWVVGKTKGSPFPCRSEDS